jgi:3-hydroxyisobutyrate dehydrogenase
MNVGIVGLGRMGANIARRLKEKGETITVVYDRTHSVARELANELNCEATKSLARVTEKSEVVITVVSDDAAMREIFSTTGDSLLTKAAGRIFVNCATVTPSLHVEIEKLAEKVEAKSLEACMAGSIPQARTGTLTLMIGGRHEVYDYLAPLFEEMSSSVIYIGSAGKAAQVKALVNMVMNINTAGLAEGLGLGDSLGLDLTMLREVFLQTGANSRVLATDGEDMQKRDHEAYFSAAHAAKDSGIALSLAQERNIKLPLAQAAYEQYELMKQLGLGDLDKSGIAELTFEKRHTRRLK